MQDRQDGTYRVLYTLTKSGTYAASVVFGATGHSKMSEPYLEYFLYKVTIKRPLRISRNEDLRGIGGLSFYSKCPRELTDFSEFLLLQASWGALSG